MTEKRLGPFIIYLIVASWHVEVVMCLWLLRLTMWSAGCPKDRWERREGTWMGGQGTDSCTGGPVEAVGSPGTWRDDDGGRLGGCWAWKWALFDYRHSWCWWWPFEVAVVVLGMHVTQSNLKLLVKKRKERWKRNIPKARDKQRLKPWSLIDLPICISPHSSFLPHYQMLLLGTLGCKTWHIENVGDGLGECWWPFVVVVMVGRTVEVVRVTCWHGMSTRWRDNGLGIFFAFNDSQFHWARDQMVRAQLWWVYKPSLTPYSFSHLPLTWYLITYC